MNSLSRQILTHAAGLAEGEPITAKGLLHVGPSEMAQLAALRTVAPGWLAQTVSDAIVARG